MRERTPDAIPVSLLTGFLGSGKTTVLARLVKHPAAGRIAAVINEFGDIDLDHDLIEASSEDVVLLGNGCLCCSIRGNLAETLIDLETRRAAFDRVVIETSGLVDPTPVLRLLLSDAGLQRHYDVGAVVTVVDALHGAAQLDAHWESVRQATLADRLLISKTDLASAGAVAALERRLRQLNPVADIIRVVQGAIEPRALLAPADIRRAPGAAAEHRHHDHGDHQHDRRIAVLTARSATALHRDDVAALLALLNDLKGPGLLRAKAILEIAGEARPIVVQAVQDMVHDPVPLAGAASENQGSRLVIITWNVPVDEIRARLPAAFRAAG